MAKIIDKAFDATKGILKTIFLGMPNLFTTSDINRQISAFRSNLDDLEDTLGCSSDLKLSVEVTDSTTTCKIKSVDYIKCRGCALPLPEVSTYTVEAGPNTECFFCVSGTYKVVDYESDATHEIAGAVFEDGTTMPAANQEVLTNVTYILTKNKNILTDMEKEGKFCFILAKILTRLGNASIIKPNYKASGSSVTMDSLNVLESLEQYSPENTPLKLGDDFNTCMNKVRNYMNYRLSPSLHDSWQVGISGSTDSFRYKVVNGVIHIMNGVNRPTAAITVPRGTKWLFDEHLTFDSATEKALIDYFTSVGYNNKTIEVTDELAATTFKGTFVPMCNGIYVLCKRDETIGVRYLATGQLGFLIALDDDNKIVAVRFVPYLDSVAFDGVGLMGDPITHNSLNAVGATYIITKFRCSLPISVI